MLLKMHEITVKGQWRVACDEREVLGAQEVLLKSLRISRRDFNKSAALGVASLAMSTGPMVRNVMGANDRINKGLIGSGGMGQADLRDTLRT